MNRYNSYKDSGVELFGDIPKNWDVVRLKYLCDIGTGNRDTINKEEDGEFPFFVRSKTVEKISSYSYDCEAILTAGDGDICKIWHYIDGKFDCHQRVYKLNNFRRVDGKFLYYFLMENFEKEVFKLSAKSTVDSLRRPMFENFNVCFPEIKFQKQIVTYLDKKTSIVDTLISSKEEKIALLKEKRTALINHAITKGIDPKVKLKDSGIEWIGEIPSHWELKKLRYLGECQNGISIGAEFFGTGFPFVSYGDVYKNEILPHKVTGLVNSSEIERERFSVCKGDVFFTRTSETINEIGIASVCNLTIENSTFAGFLIRFRPTINSIFIGFSRYIFSSYIPRIYFVKEMNLVTRASLSQELLKRLPVLLPPFDEQIEISNFLDTHTQEIDELISLEQKKIVALKEYRQALISEVVTGKIKVVKD
jgi:type I restriction enzyme S subunit